jgi:hypothetical protein
MSSAGRCPACGALAGHARVDAHAAGFEAGRLRGLVEGTQVRADMGLPPTFSALVDELIALCHPDRHQGGREDQATRATQALLQWRDDPRSRRG